MAKRKRTAGQSTAAIMTADLERAKDPSKTSWDDGWAGLETTFQSKKSIELYTRYEDDEDRYFEHPYMVGKVKQVGRRMAKKFKSKKGDRAKWCLFSRVELSEDKDLWDVARSELKFSFAGGAEALQVNFGMDPFTFEFGIKPVPLKWLYDEQFVLFLQKLVFDVPLKHGLSASILNGGGQFHLSAKPYLTGSLLADDLSTRINHPELSTWVLDWPNCDDRAMRSTPQRFAAYREALDDYWRGAYHPRARGIPTAQNALLDHRFEPARQLPVERVMTDAGPAGSAVEVFQNNFAFGRSVRWRAQNVHPGYWQSAHPDVDGYQPHQVMRNTEVNLNRLQIAGELHVKNGKVLHAERAPELDAALEPSMLIDEASYEHRAHISRTSAQDYVDAILLEVHHARWLQQHSNVLIVGSLAQDQLGIDAEQTVKKHAGAAALQKLKKAARAFNLEQSQGRIKSDFIEPETLFFAAWACLPKGAKAEIAREAVNGFTERVHQAASVDPRGSDADPMDAHRHRIHPLLWEALKDEKGTTPDAAAAELRRFLEDPAGHLSKRPVFSQVGEVPPWEKTGV